MNHTNHKLYVPHDYHLHFLVDPPDRFSTASMSSCDTVNSKQTDEHKANARRLAACWNAFHGVDTDTIEKIQIEKIPVAPGNLADHLKDLTAQAELYRRGYKLMGASDISEYLALCGSVRDNIDSVSRFEEATGMSIGLLETYVREVGRCEF